MEYPRQPLRHRRRLELLLYREEGARAQSGPGRPSASLPADATQMGGRWLPSCWHGAPIENSSLRSLSVRLVEDTDPARLAKLKGDLNRWAASTTCLTIHHRRGGEMQSRDHQSRRCPRDGHSAPDARLVYRICGAPSSLAPHLGCVVDLRRRSATAMPGVTDACRQRLVAAYAGPDRPRTLSPGTRTSTLCRSATHRRRESA